MSIDLEYYKTVIATQNDPKILKAELWEFVKEFSAALAEAEKCLNDTYLDCSTDYQDGHYDGVQRVLDIFKKLGKRKEDAK